MVHLPNLHILKTICIEIFEITNSNTFVRVGLCNRIRFPNYVNKVKITDSQRNYIRQNNMFRVEVMQTSIRVEEDWVTRVG